MQVFMAMKKKSVLLLELLIAMSIVAAVLTPLVTLPHYAYKREKGILAELEGERVADLSFAEIYKGLKKRKFASLSSRGEAVWEELNELDDFDRSFKLGFYSTEEAELQSGEHYRLLTCTLTLEQGKFEKSYERKFLVKKK